MRIAVANWKADKTQEDSLVWVKRFGAFWRDKIHLPGGIKEIEIVVCPGFTALDAAKNEIRKLGLPIKLGAQTVSHFENGPHTGQVTAAMISPLVDYCLVGHSEVRQELRISDKEINQELERLKEVKIKPILLASDLEQAERVCGVLRSLRRDDYAVTFEPIEAISKEGAYKSLSAEKVKAVLADWKKKLGLNCRWLYGGSVNPGNAGELIKQPDIDGFVVGQASLDPESFLRIIQVMIEE